jgi:alpha,alpha-trehalose-phosphate synthase [UDP-forming]
LLPIVEECGGKWVAANTGSREREALITEHFPGLRYVDVSPEEFRSYYLGFSNSALWPLCHYFLDRARFTLADWEGYKRVNLKFAACLARESEPGNVVWVHDYHLCLVPGFLRSKLRDVWIAYFYHIPFPAPDVFRVLPWHAEVLAGMLGADQIGFHTQSYRKNFLEACATLPNCQVDFAENIVHFDGRAVRIGAFPIGIDVREINRIAGSTSTRNDVNRIRKAHRVEKLLLGVDRLDYTKGIVQRFEAIDNFFQTYPDLKGAVTLLQIAVPCRENVSEYRSLKRNVDELIGRVNGMHSQDGWQPIQCTYRSYSLRRLIAYYQAADVALVTPVRDGMNLVAKEFCASRIDGDGVLVLSEFAGASEQLGRASLLVNPFDLSEFTSVINQALSMSPEDRRERMSALRRIVASNSVEDWFESIVADVSRNEAIGMV